MLQLMKLEELVAEEREIRTALTNRAGVLGLLLHQTIDHDPNNFLQPSPATSN